MIESQTTTKARPLSTTERGQPLQPFRLGVFNIRLHDRGEPDQNIFLPICSVCREPVRDFKMANLVWDNLEDEFEPAGTVNGNEPLFAFPNTEVYVLHKSCDPPGPDSLACWCPLAAVLRTQQWLYAEGFF